jgi:MFS family permease
MDSQLQHNFRHLYADVLWYGVLAGSSMAFLSIYAARLGANSYQVSLLTAGPAVVNLLFSLPVGRWLERQPLINATFWSAVLMRLGYLLYIPLPWLFAAQRETSVFILLTIGMSIPGVILAIGFNALFADVVPPEWRGEVVGKRNALLALSMSLTLFFGGRMLDRIVFPLNYQLLFTLGGLGAALSTYHVGRLCPPQELPRRMNLPLDDLARPGLMRFIDGLRAGVGLRYLTRLRGKKLLRLDLLRTSFGPLMGVYFLFYMFQYLPLPLFPLWYVNGLHLTDWEIGIGSALFYGTMLLTSLRLSRLSSRYGHRWVLYVGGLLFATFPLFTALAWDAKLYWTACFLGGGVYSLVNAGLINRLMERVPVGDRPAHMALHNLALNLGILSGSLAAPLIAGLIGLRDSLLISAGLRLLGGILLVLWG